MKRTLKLSPVANLSSVMSGGEIVAFNADFDEIVYLVVALKLWTTESKGQAPVSRRSCLIIRRRTG